ncbi:hypothetical protein HBI81_020600 [Parastagonospora nodorum]|nr:hypothetical protein HBH52_166480 [Parastagonospora nodorum]KAH5016910.1 hypothetical protein HBI74_169240 [Parastagonospora nodorum]KAH6544005.1 hypothetical protein HBI81_020600 [Parastagonospora nodorum]
MTISVYIANARKALRLDRRTSFPSPLSINPVASVSISSTLPVSTNSIPEVPPGTLNDLSMLTNVHSGQQPITKCNLLSLPGEVRNRIYDFTQESRPVNFLSRRFDDVDDSELSPYQMRKAVPEYHSLTQVCRQLRAEYSPIYAATTEVRVFQADLMDFASKNYPYLARDPHGNVTGHLTIIFAFAFGNRHCNTVDLLAFLNHCKTLKNLHIRAPYYPCIFPRPDAEKDWESMGVQMDALLDVARRPKLQEWLQNIERITVNIRFAWIEYHVRAEKREDWMKQWRSADGCIVQLPGFRRWVEVMGIAPDRELRMSPWAFQ